MVATSVNYHSILSIYRYLRLINEIHLDNFIIQAKENSILSFQPSFDVAKNRVIRFCLRSALRITCSSCKTWWSVQILSEILHQSHFLGNLPILWNLIHPKTDQIHSLIIWLSHIVYFSALIKILLIWSINNHLAPVVKTYSRRSIRQKIP